MQEEIFGPVLVSTTFRTPAEAVELANNTRYGLAATVWTENVNLALDIAPKLVAGVVWVNATNLFDAAAGFGGVRESGFGREGGWEGLLAYTRPRGRTKAVGRIAAMAAPKDADGRCARPDGEAVCRRQAGAARWRLFDGRLVEAGKLLGHAGLANRKDMRNAVEAARGAAAWAKTTGHVRAQILYYIAENLSARTEEFAARLRDLTNAGANAARAEVEASIQRLFTYAAWADKYDGAAKGVPLRGVALAMNEPVGVIGAFCPDEAPLLGLISVIAPAMAMGNRVVAVASRALPAGGDRLLPGARHLGRAGRRGQHPDRQPCRACAAAGGAHGCGCGLELFVRDLSAVIEREAAGNLKRTWVNNGRARDWLGTEGEGRAFLAGRDRGQDDLGALRRVGSSTSSRATSG